MNRLRNDHPLLLFVHEDVAEDRPVFVARCLTTGHAAMATTRDLAVRCLLGTIEGNRALAERDRGVSAEDWFRAQRPGDAEYARQWIRSANEHGIERIPLSSPSRYALVNVA